MKFKDVAEDRFNPLGGSSIINTGLNAGQRRAQSSWMRPWAVMVSALERVGALVALLLWSPFMLIFAGCIRLSGRDPIFRQDRVGLGGRDFQILKFRTMPDEGWEAAEARAAESRLAGLQLRLFRGVSLGLRTSGLDELPQFINILKGDMQIIGPRPLMREDFLDLPERRMERCAVRPGITGLAQINGGQDLDSESKLALDLYMINALSLSMAVKILWRTVMRVCRGNAATADTCKTDLELARRAMGKTAGEMPRAAAQARTKAVLAKPLITSSDLRPRAAIRAPAPTRFQPVSVELQEELTHHSAP